MKAKYLSKTSQQFIYVVHVIYFQVLYLIITTLCNYCCTYHFDIYFVNICVYSAWQCSMFIAKLCMDWLCIS